MKTKHLDGGTAALAVNAGKDFCVVGATDVATFLAELKKLLVLGKLVRGESGSCGIPSLARM